MHTVTYAGEKKLGFYAPQYFKSVKSYSLDPNESMLVLLDQHDRLERLGTIPCPGGCYRRREKLCLLVRNCSADHLGQGMHIFIPAHSNLDTLLGLPQIQSHWAVVMTKSIKKKSKKKKKARIMTKKEKTSCPMGCQSMPEEEEYDDENEVDEHEDEKSCTSSCNHSDIDDGVHMIDEPEEELA